MSTSLFFKKIVDRWPYRLFFSAVIVFLVLLPYVGGARVIRGDDAEVFIPALSFFKEALQTGESLFWNPYLAVGLPHFIATGFPYNPVNFLVLLFDPITAQYLAMFFLLAFTLFFAISFLREIKIGFFGSLIGGLAYLMGNVYFANNYQKITVILTQIVLFWAIIKLVRSEKFKAKAFYVGVGGLTIAYGWIANGYSSNLYLSLSSVAFVFFLAWSDRWPNKNAPPGLGGAKRRLARLLASWFLMFLIGTILGLVQIIPAASLNRFSGRAEGLAYDTAVSDAIDLPELANFISLLSLGNGSDASLYFGLIPLLFFMLSFTVKNPTARFFRWLFLVALLAAITHSPLFWLMLQLPFFDLFRGASRIMTTGILGAAVSAGFGADYFLGLIESRYQIIKLWLWLYFSAALIFILLLFKYLIFVFQGGGSSAPLIISAMLLGLAVSSITIVLKNGSFRNWIIPILAALTVLDFVYVFYAYIWPTTIPRSVYESKPLTAGFFEENPGRIFSFFPDDFDSDYYDTITGQPPPRAKFGGFEYDRETYYPNLSALWRVENLEAYDPFININMGRLMALLGAGRQLLSESTAGEKKLDKFNLIVADKGRIFKTRLGLANFLGIKYFLSGYDLHSLDMDLPLNFKAELRIFETKAGFPYLLVYENPAAKPIIYFSAIDGFRLNNEAVYQSFKNSAFNGIFVECQLCLADKGIFNAGGDVRIEHHGSGSIKLSTTAPGNRFLIFSQNFLPGWVAFIDGQAAPLYRVNTVFMGVFVPPGDHSVSFEYRYLDFFSFKSLRNMFTKTAIQPG